MRFSKLVDDKIKKMLQDKGATNIEFYMLVNNDGYTFELEGVRFDLRHWRNVYGVETDFWDVMYLSNPNEKSHILAGEIKAEANRINEEDQD